MPIPDLEPLDSLELRRITCDKSGLRAPDLRNDQKVNRADGIPRRSDVGAHFRIVTNRIHVELRQNKKAQK